MNNIDSIDIMQPRRPVSSSARHNRRRTFTDYLFHFVVLSIIIGSVLFFAAEDINVNISTTSQQQQQQEAKVSVMSSTTTSNPKLKYDLVLSSKDDDNDDHPTLLRYSALEEIHDGTYQPISVYRWASLVSNDNDFIIQFNDILKDSQMKAFFFETKGVTLENSKTKLFEFVLIETNYLYNFADSKQDSVTFGDHLDCDPIPPIPSSIGNNSNNEEKETTAVAQPKASKSTQQQASACVFPNLGGDSILIAPTLLQKDGNNNENNIYGHLGAFIRRAPSEQIIDTWKLTLQTYLQRLADVAPLPTWFSTDGTGVAWLHFRLDPSPKYYDYKEFANEH